MIDFVEFTVVAATSELKVSKFTQSWMTKARIVEEDDIKEGSFFTPVAVTLATEVVQIAIFPGRIQTRATSQWSEDSVAKTLAKMTSILNACDDEWVELMALGVNINVVLHDDSPHYWGRVGSLLSESASPFSDHFDYLSIGGWKEMGGDVRAQLEMKQIHSVDNSKEALFLCFNFNLDTVSRMKAVEMLSNSDQYIKFVNEVASTLDSRLSNPKEGES